MPSSGPVATVTREGAALAGHAVDGDVAAEHLGQPLADGQSQAGAAEACGWSTSSAWVNGWKSLANLLVG